MKKNNLLLFSLIISIPSVAQVFSTPGGVVGNNSSTDVVSVNGNTKLINPNGRTLLIERDDEDSWLTFHDPGEYWYSMGIDRSNNGSFTINLGGTLTGSNSLIINPSGNVGIRTTAPLAALDVGAFISNGSLGTVFGRLPEGNNSGAGTYLGVRGYATQGDEYSGKSFALEHAFYGEVNSTINFYRGGGVTGGYLTFNTDNNIERMRITTGGNVAIGTTTPDAKLTVKGDIHAHEVRVDLNGAIAPDYVFEKDYDLLPLTDLETYISQNKHLPEVPSAKTMEANGLNLKEMNLLLLKKVEELTLHLIELKKENENQENKIAQQQLQINKLLKKQ